MGMEDKSIILSFLKTLLMAEVSGGVMWKHRFTPLVDSLFVTDQEVGGRSGNGEGRERENSDNNEGVFIVRLNECVIKENHRPNKHNAEKTILGCFFRNACVLIWR